MIERHAKPTEIALVTKRRGKPHQNIAMQPAGAAPWCAILLVEHRKGADGALRRFAMCLLGRKAMLGIRRREFEPYRPGNARRRNALHKASALLLFSVLSVARDGRALEPSPPQIPVPDIQNCLVTKALPEEARTELLPDGACPIRINQRCFEKSYGLTVSNKCGTAIRIQVDAGTRGKYGSSTGEYTLRPGDSTGFRCLEANRGCTGVQARVLSFAQSQGQGTARPRAATPDGGSSEVSFVRNGTVVPSRLLR